MIYHDKDTAEKFRKEARKQLIDDIVMIADDVAKLADTWTNAPEYLKRDHIKMLVDRHPRLWKTLLYRSGIIYGSSDPDPIHDIILYHDDDTRDAISTAMVRHGMRGGIDFRTGQIHT